MNGGCWKTGGLYLQEEPKQQWGKQKHISRLITPVNAIYEAICMGSTPLYNW